MFFDRFRRVPYISRGASFCLQYTYQSFKLHQMKILLPPSSRVVACWIQISSLLHRSRTGGTRQIVDGKPEAKGLLNSQDGELGLDVQENGDFLALPFVIACS